MAVNASSLDTHTQVHGVSDTLLPCPPELYDTLKKIATRSLGAQVGVSMNSIIHTDNTIRGWYCTFPPSATIQNVPFQSDMFSGITVVETAASETQILDLLKNRAGTMKRVRDFAIRNASTNVTNRVSWARCRPNRKLPLQRINAWQVQMRPDHLSQYVQVDGSSVRVLNDAPVEVVPDDTVPNFLDSAAWDPELSEGGYIGLYHQWYEMHGTGERELKLYIVCQSSCQNAGLEIRQIVNDLPLQTTVAQVAGSEEVWWLSNVNMRNRNRLILLLAEELGIHIPTVEDYHAFHPNMNMAHPLAHTFLSALYTTREGEITFTNECIPTSHVSSGIVCRMAPWDGVWVFKGPHANAHRPLGTGFGTSNTAFPLTVVKLNSKMESDARDAQFVVVRGSQNKSSVWTDIATQPVQVDAVSSGSDDDLVSDRALLEMDEIDTSSFNAVSDPELNSIALDAWKRAKYAAMRRNEPRHQSHNHSQRTQEKQKRNAVHAYMTFDDFIVLNRLQKVHWDPRYGVMKLLPICVATNKI